uniref:Ig-like domain-containing protein n=1 Tax=Catharus ustulatus TaxID=91951 RepID=A0A8C3UDY2_CATUS
PTMSDQHSEIRSELASFPLSEESPHRGQVVPAASDSQCAQTPQLLVEPPWTPAVLWDRVTLTCQGSGTAGATTWYKDGRAWGQEGPDIFTVTRSGTYQCQRPGTGLSPPVTVSDDWLVLQVPARALLEGDTVTLRCRVWQNNPVTSVSFYRDGKELGTLQNGTELSLSPLQRNHSGHYHCRGWLGFLGRWEQSEPVAVTVARGQCHHHPRSPGTPGDTTAGGDTTGNHWTPLEHRWGHSGFPCGSETPGSQMTQGHPRSVPGSDTNGTGHRRGAHEVSGIAEPLG